MSHSRSRDGEVRPKRHATTHSGRVAAESASRCMPVTATRAVLRDLAGLRTRLGLLASAPSRQNSGRLACRAASTRAFVAERGGRHAHAHTRLTVSARVARRTPIALPRRHTGASAPPPTDSDRANWCSEQNLSHERRVRTRASPCFSTNERIKKSFFFFLLVSHLSSSLRSAQKSPRARVHPRAARPPPRPSPPRKGPARRARARSARASSIPSRAPVPRASTRTVRRATSRTKVPWSCSGASW